MLLARDNIRRNTLMIRKGIWKSITNAMYYQIIGVNESGLAFSISIIVLISILHKLENSVIHGVITSTQKQCNELQYWAISLNAI